MRHENGTKILEIKNLENSLKFSQIDSNKIIFATCFTQYAKRASLQSRDTQSINSSSATYAEAGILR